MKAQSRRMVVIEKSIDIAIGLCVSTALNLALLPVIHDWPLATATSLMVASFTVASFARGYATRRLFERLRTRNTPPDFVHIIEEIAAERLRQIRGEGFSLAHDDEHANGELASGAAAYCLAAVHRVAAIGAVEIHEKAIAGTWTDIIRRAWPWGTGSFKPTVARRNLVKACAMLVAEIGRLDRAAARKS